MAAAAATAVEVLLPVAVPAVEALPTLEALLPLLPALLPPTVSARLKFIGIGLEDTLAFVGATLVVCGDVDVAGCPCARGCGCVLDWRIHR